MSAWWLQEPEPYDRDFVCGNCGEMPNDCGCDWHYISADGFQVNGVDGRPFSGTLETCRAYANDLLSQNKRDYYEIIRVSKRGGDVVEVVGSYNLH